MSLTLAFYDPLGHSEVEGHTSGLHPSPRELATVLETGTGSPGEEALSELASTLSQATHGGS